MTVFLLSMIFAPLTAAAEQTPMTLRDHATIRAVQRLERRNDEGQRTSVIRLGRNVRTRDMSMRRMLNVNEGTVLDVIDGSVLVVLLDNGEIEGVHTLGAEAPLLEGGSSKEQCFALEAKEALTHLILGKTITLERDRNYQRDYDRRLLRYVQLNALDVNGWMIENGYAFADDNTYHKRFESYQLRETEARESDLGLWGNYCIYNPSPSLQFDIE
ncbi:thermonuclease family protein [Candidatus Peribacteria bacterium]|nr:thermonuclease family protein [Candidatus Peribacteria bacterium]